MKNLFLFLTLIAIFLCFNSIYSLPRFSVRLGDKCIDCHYNPTGGIIRNDNGFYYGQNILGMISPRSKEFSMSPKLNENVSIGIDLRGQILYSREKKNYDFQRMTGSIYGRIGISKKINVLTRYDFVNDIWEAYGIAHILPNNSYIKAGSFQPNFGIRIDDHTAYTRGGDSYILFQNGASAGLIYDFLHVEAGLEVGAYISDFALLTASIGTRVPTFLNNLPFKKDPTYTTRLEVSPSFGKVGLMFGGSYVAAKVPQAIEIYGGFLGFGYDRFSLLGEFDIADKLFGPEVKSNALMLEAAYNIIVGLEAYVRYDRMDGNVDLDKNEIAHLIIGFEFFPYSFIEIRPQYRFIIENAKLDNDSAIIQFHIWY